jgi:hypothetical protein
MMNPAQLDCQYPLYTLDLQLRHLAAAKRRRADHFVHGPFLPAGILDIDSERDRPFRILRDPFLEKVFRKRHLRLVVSQGLLLTVCIGFLSGLFLETGVVRQGCRRWTSEKRISQMDSRMGKLSHTHQEETPASS